MNYPKEILRKKLDEASQPLQDMVFSTEKSEKIEALAQKFSLSADQRIKLEELVNLILIRLEPMVKLRALLTSDVGLSYDQAIKITPDLQNLFAPVAAELEREPEPPAPDEGETNTETEEEVPELEPVEPVTPDHLLDTHEHMEQVSGAHTHMPPVVPVHKMESGIPNTYNSGSTPPVRSAPAPSNIPSSTSTPSFTTVDQKLRGLVRAEREETTIRNDVEERRKIAYKDGDPYREPLN